MRLRPIKGKDGVQAVLQFMTEHLKLSDSFVECLGPIQVLRVPSGPAAKIKNEAVVTFQSVEPVMRSGVLPGTWQGNPLTLELGWRSPTI